MSAAFAGLTSRAFICQSGFGGPKGPETDRTQRCPSGSLRVNVDREFTRKPPDFILERSPVDVYDMNHGKSRHGEIEALAHPPAPAIHRGTPGNALLYDLDNLVN